MGVLDIDSVFLDDFDQDDVQGMSDLVDIMVSKWEK
jgi:putative methionine-R-sulfoxide reductase with GAF domain